MRSSTSASSIPYRSIARTSEWREAETLSAELEDTLLLARTSMPALAAVSVVLTFCFWDTPQRGAMLVLLACMLVPAGVAFAASLVFGGRALAASSVLMARGASGALAFLIGSAWAAVPLTLFAPSDGTHKLIIVGIVGGVLAVVYALGPMVSVCFLFGGPIVAGTLAALALSGDGAAAWLSVLLVVYALYLAVSRAALENLDSRRRTEPTRMDDMDAFGPILHGADDTEARWRFELDERGRLRNVSDALAAAGGVARLQLEGAVFKSLFEARMPSAPKSASARALVDRIAARGAFSDHDVEIKTAEGTLWWRFDGKPVHNDNGAFAGHRGTCVDVTAARLADARIAFLTTHDALTGIANREVLQAKMAEACAVAARAGSRQALVLLDIDGFKMVNDGFGHAVGDAVLRQVATRLSALAPSAVVARLGDDEFGVMCHVGTLAAAESLAQSLIGALTPSYATGGVAVAIGASAGVAVTPDHAADATALFAKAELALRRAKTSGKGCHRLFVASYEESLADRRVLEDDLKLALARREFTLHYQPLVDLASGRVSSFEALIRWTSQTRGAMAPSSFIPAAEAMGLIVPIGRWVLAEACNEAARWDPTIAIAVNISPQHFRSPDFVQDVLTTLAASGLHASRLEIEITEGVLLDHSDVALENLEALRRRGVRVALDDFGTGFSSLSYLVNFPVDRIKIDRSFVRDLVRRRESRVIVEAILTLAKQLSIRVTAEGVETIDQALALKMLRCDTIQGFLLSPAKPAAEIEGLVATIPKLLESMIPMLFDSPLALALALKKQSGDEKAERRDSARGVASARR